MFFRVIAVVLLIAVAVGAGAVVYDAGVTAGLQQAAVQAAASGGTPVVPPYAYGPYHWGGGFGFGIFGIFFWILGFFLIIGLLRAAFGWGRWGGGGRSGPAGWGGPGAGGRRAMIEEWHREMHRGEAGQSGQSGDPTRPASA